MSKESLELNISRSQASWLEDKASAHSLPDAGKALRCCVNFVAQATQASLPNQEEVSGTETVCRVFELSTEQSGWVKSIAQLRFGGDPSAAVRAILRRCERDATDNEVFGTVRCKSRTPAACEGYQTAMAAGLQDGGVVDAFVKKDSA
mmetsp:Transcript_9501/g.21800  ORF Transcript_9501/g.21800 Transcript_9501/m.21800 type:complete len:148 (+) Transcript_9501:47-490(+)|eukprot:3659040-Amphidinium_carterae.1